ncbi:hypothetical protein HYPSUDRAFT_867066 [Hypholoma sublateritium FD-334 SS-4]|uniref:DUF6534 domain-containing protein n=1 Tax=Hypholoma sublateritium (strain FD-334 SS-4) TaxID=945553 RepID=A0A0D2MUI9_HYPSF|nr:hypothetical protein HYPSUDRAFT_867066 [Hypholoma sublateritium FD-334 SS-4]
MSNSPTDAPLKLPELVYTDAASVVLGTMAQWILFGVLLVQAYLYCIAFPEDRRFLKLNVLVQLLLETVQTVMFTYDIFHHFTRADPAELNEAGTSWLSITLMIGVIASITQGFYCYRVCVLTRSKYAVVLISMLSLGQLSAAIYVTVQEKRVNILTSLLSQNAATIGIIIWAACSFSCDILIAAIMSYYLKKRDTGFEDTHDIIVRLIRLSIETGCITALLDGVVLVLTYSNSMMAMLNSRVKPVSNAPTYGAPLWQELLEKPIESMYSSKRTQGRRTASLFCRDSEAGFSSSRGSVIVLP